MAKYSFINRSGEQVSFEITTQDYRAAASQGRSLAQYLEHKFGGQADTKAYGSVFRQACQSVGIYETDVSRGLHAPTVGEVLNGQQASTTGSIISPDGSDSTPAGRILYPEIVMGIMRDSLAETDDALAGFEKMIALNETIYGDLFVQPMINKDANEDTRSQVTSQLALPPAMVNITTSQYAKSIQTKSVGLMISEQALNHTSLDLVGIAVAAQSRGERIQMMYDGMAAIMTGDKDVGQTALTAVKANTFDSAIVAAGTMSHKAFLHMLYDQRKKRSISSMICDIDTYLSYQDRAGRPVVDKIPAGVYSGSDTRLDVGHKPINFSLEDLNVLLVDPEVFGANTAMMFDHRFALRRVTNANASYDAVEQFVLRRAMGLRIDYGWILTRIYDEAFLPISLTV